MIPIYNNYFMFYPWLPPNCDKPPTLYAVLNSIVNGDKEEEDYTKIKDLAKEGRKVIFNFDYPLTEHITKEKFETLILNHYLMRRIGFETVTAFRIQLDAKLNEIMPMYNKMFDALEDWNIFEDGEVVSKRGNNETTNNTENQLNNTSTTSTNNISDRRNSELPQNQLSNLRDGSYVTDYNYDTVTNTGSDTSISSGTSNAVNNNEYTETITTKKMDKLTFLKVMQENINSIYTLIFQDLDVLFYSLY